MQNFDNISTILVQNRLVSTILFLLITMLKKASKRGALKSIVDLDEACKKLISICKSKFVVRMIISNAENVGGF